jgi:gluconate 2-dehydrogenase gamma chain
VIDPKALMNRRQALARAAYLLGGALSASTVAGVLAGCDASRGVTADGAWVPRTLSPEQSQMVLIMGEHILPETDTPGARAAQVDRFIDVMLTDYYGDEERQRFLAGLVRAETRARRVFGDSFAALPHEQQLELSMVLNREAFRDRAPQTPVPAEQVARPADPLLQEHNVQTETQRAGPTVDSDWDPEDAGPRAFFRRLKELVVVGYYTSELGATQELRENPMGTWRSDMPYSEVGRAWA